ncbi:MAG TPA: hypothetical protein PK014_08380 [Thermoanaerobaculia bacterium]|nr:hypothetical protein [Thermoanaerobaculia bacterium]HUM30155.1 hypothetical protein [Thermoanaerobaculia bacterium]HXK68395.1 hypothetical protein [Thermoanaerobaculia bacterium]
MPDLPVPVSNQEEERIIVIRPDGSQELIGLTQNMVVLDEQGNRRFIKQKSVIMTGDGRLVMNPEKARLYQCATCPEGTLSTHHTIRTCRICHLNFCLHHAQEMPNPDGTVTYFCLHHARRQAWMRRLGYLFSLER